MHKILGDSLLTSPLTWAVPILLVGSIIVTATVSRRGRDTISSEGSAFANFLWLFIGGGLVLAAVLVFLSVIIGVFPGMRKVRTAIRSAVKFACAPAEYRLRRSHHYTPLPQHHIWFIFAGLWLGFAELLFGIAYCCTLVGIQFGLTHFKFARFLLFPCAHRLMTIQEYDEHMSVIIHEGR